ncbi:hypothetical protein [Deinococcus sp. Leaf326]|uniref:hypothetical protein n=1 Tax=Deinococcus sp. Leaf326 TaxID=1736338 RepID=UPI0006F61054|nr:hypothetical protein [Deinococcus sp. Leaf326]KQR40777.1 hypothetical protein ASF71_01000 [Deinococcus sp. Leaf326]
MSFIDVEKIMTPEERARLVELETQVMVGGAAAVLAGKALTEIRDARLYRAEHATFEAYTLARFSMSRSRAYQLIEYAADASEFDLRGWQLPPERITRALGGVVPEDWQVVLDVTRATTGKQKPSSADVAAVAEAARTMANGVHIQHPVTGEQVPYSSLPPEKRGFALATAVQRGSRERRDYQGADFQGNADQEKPWDWLDGLRSSGADVAVLGRADGWQVTATDRTTGEVREGPTRPNQWDAIRGARAAWEGELPT